MLYSSTKQHFIFRQVCVSTKRVLSLKHFLARISPVLFTWPGVLAHAFIFSGSFLLSLLTDSDSVRNAECSVLYTLTLS